MAEAMRRGKIPTLSELIAAASAEFLSILDAGTELAQEVDRLADALIAHSESFAETGLNDARALLACRNVREAMKIQATAARKAVDRFFEEYQRASDRSAALAERALAPLRARLDAAFDHISALHRR